MLQTYPGLGLASPAVLPTNGMGTSALDAGEQARATLRFNKGGGAAKVVQT